MAKGKKTGGRDFVPGDERIKPGGLPPSYWEMRAKAQGYGLEAIDAAVTLMRDEDWRARATGINILLERGFGKPQSAPEDLDAVASGPSASRELVLAALERLAKGGE